MGKKAKNNNKTCNFPNNSLPLESYRSKFPRPHRKNESRENRVSLEANYFRLNRKPTWTISRYHASFEPEVEAARFRAALIAQHKSVIGNFLFDGGQVFAARRLDLADDQVTFESRSREGQAYRVTLKFTGAISGDSREFSQILNLIQRRATKALNFQLVGRNYYDPNSKVSVYSSTFVRWWARERNWLAAILTDDRCPCAFRSAPG